VSENAPDDEGFVALDALGVPPVLFDVWPAEHRAEPASVRSPWPGLSANDVVGLLGAWLAQHEAHWADARTAQERARCVEAAHDFFVAFDAAFRQEWDEHMRGWM
jgi:hypothetical protein